MGPSLRPRVVASYILHIASNELVWNNNSFTAFGYPPDEPANTLDWWIAHIHPEDALQINDKLDKLLDPTITTWTTAYRFEKADGSYAHVQDLVTVQRNAQGSAEILIGSLSLV